MLSKKILVVTPRFPIPTLGACEQDRLNGLKQLKRLGFDVRVITKVFAFQNKEAIIQWGKDNGIIIDLIDYEIGHSKSLGENILFYLRRFINPLYWDGAAYEYSHKNVRNVFRQVIMENRPDSVWFDYTYLWPLYILAKEFKIPIIVRSINFEAIHFLQEDGYTPFNFFKFIPKLLSELLTVHKSDVVLAITPKEEKLYRRLGAKKVLTLPLRGLSRCLKQIRDIPKKEQLNIFFMGSTYNVSHNRRALEFILKEIVPTAQTRCPGKFKFHIIGSKVPVNLQVYFNAQVIYHGVFCGQYLEDFLLEMDIALIPSLFGAGMQQKIFEPLARGIPSVISPRGLVGYPFINGKHLLLATSREEFVEKIIDLQNINLRASLSVNALDLCGKIFSQNVLDRCVVEALIKN